MKTINSLALLAFIITLTAYFMSAGTVTAQSETGGDRTIVDLLPAKRQASPLQVMDAKPIQAPTPEEPNPLLDAVMAGNLCALEELKQKNYTPDKKDFAALKAAIDPSPAFAELLAENGPALATAEPKKKYSHKPARLLWALRLSGQSFIGSAPENLPEARKQLLELEKEDPSNAALPFFRLGVEKKLNLDAKVLAETESKIGDGSDFDLYMDDLVTELNQAKWQSPTAHRLIEHIGYFAVPTPNLYDGVSALQNSTTLSEDSRNRIVAVMKQRALRSTPNSFNRDMNAEIFENARSLGKDYMAPSIYQMALERERALGIEAPNFPYFKSGADCDSRPYEDYFFTNRGKY